MSRAQELLDAATPLPWRRPPLAGYIEGRWSDGQAFQLAVFTQQKNAALAEFAVNALPAYEAAREALETIRRDYGKVCDQYEICEHAACSSSYSAWATADAALARLRDEVPA